MVKKYTDLSEYVKGGNKMKIKEIMIIIGLLSVLLLVGCTSHDSAYFDMPCDTLGCIGCENQEVCDNLCENSGIRINKYRGKNTVFFSEGKFICKCY